MNILLINKFHYPRDGATTYYFALAEMLEKHGHRVAFFSTNHPATLPSPWRKYFPSYIDLEKSYPLSKSIGIAFKILYNREARRKLRELLKAFKPDVAHLQNISYHLTPSIIDELHAHGIPMVMTLHDYKLISPNYSLFLRGKIWERSKPAKYYRCIMDKCVGNAYVKSALAALEAYIHRIKESYQKIHLLIAPSEFLKNKFHEYGFKGRIETLLNPVYVTSSCPIPRAGIQEYFFYYGRLSEEKGIPVILEALTFNQNHRLKIVGEGPQRHALERLVEAKGLKGRIQFFGFQTGDMLKQLMCGAKAVIIPSLWYEVLGYAVSESMAQGKIVIASNIGGIPELIEHGKTGFLFPAGDAEALSNIMRNLDTIDTRTIGANARERIKELNPERFYEKLLKIYLSAMNASQ